MESNGRPGPVIASSLTEERTWYVFRYDGKEVRFRIATDGRVLAQNYKLTQGELAYINKHLKL